MKKKFNEQQNNHGPEHSSHRKHHPSLTEVQHDKHHVKGINSASFHRRLENRRSGRH